ncbi:Phosducin-like protein 2 [Drechmeria coniospora]|uniref:Phosducin-like protein 2 n=1 Tax=Drechmeria coniospora TaxID=98403 RepID=A0A151GPF1_DRECN|nr:Phosducin-like protein 2 [Drechmeria coniospora]KYK58987.1 Phosducin-like protein 2 [Drechmeria coniospora]
MSQDIRTPTPMGAIVYPRRYVDMSNAIRADRCHQPRNKRLLSSERAALGQAGLATGGLAEDRGAALADDDGLGVREDGCDGEAAGALDVHEEGPGRGDQSLSPSSSVTVVRLRRRLGTSAVRASAYLELVLLGLGGLRRVEEIDSENLTSSAAVRGLMLGSVDGVSRKQTSALGFSGPFSRDATRAPRFAGEPRQVGPRKNGPLTFSASREAAAGQSDGRFAFLDAADDVHRSLSGRSIMAAPGDQRIAVPIDDPNADTEWNDILRKHGVIPEKPPSPTPMIEEALAEGRRLAYENRLEGKDLDELDELEDLEDDEFLDQYRRKRMAELNSLQKTSVHGSVYPISKPDYQREVTEASRDGPVLVNLTSTVGTNVESRVLTELWRQAAREYGDVKFCEIGASQAIENYPDRNCPTILVYDKGDIVKQVVTLMTVGGVRMGMRQVDDVLVEVGAVSDKDMRVVKRRQQAEDAEEERLAGVTRGTTDDDDDDDDDWD